MSTVLYRIAFLADTHLGTTAKVRSNQYGINMRVQDGYDAWVESVKQILETHAETPLVAVVHGGDLFQVSNPNIRDIVMAQRGLRKFAEVGLPFYGVAGNHDTNDVKSALPSVAAVHDPDRNIHAIYRPYEKFEVVDGMFLHAISHHGLHQDSSPDVQAVENALNIFTTHGSALDPANQTLLRCAGPREQIIPPELVIDDTFNIKLLGHYHTRYAVGGPELNTWYAGSSFRRGFSDEPGPRGWLLIEVYDDGTIKVVPKDIKQRPQYDLDVIDADQKTVLQVMEEIENNINQTKDTDKDPIVRQRIINVSKNIRDGLDNDKISELTSHMLQWKLEKISPEFVLSEGVENNRLSLGRAGSNNITDTFNEWITHEVSHVPEEFKDVVLADAKNFIAEARNKALGEES